MKKYLAPVVVLAAALSLAVSAHAQAAGSTSTQDSLAVQAPGKHGNSPKILQTVIKNMNLSAAQKAKIKDIARANAKDVLELRRNVQAGTISAAAAKVKQKALHKSLMDSIKATLSPDRAKQFEAAVKTEMKKHNVAEPGSTAGGN